MKDYDVFAFAQFRLNQLIVASSMTKEEKTEAVKLVARLTGLFLDAKKEKWEDEWTGENDLSIGEQAELEREVKERKEKKERDRMLALG